MKENKADLPLSSVKGVGPGRARLLAKLGLSSVTEAFYHLPLRYEDRTHLKSIAEVCPGASETVSGRIVSARVVRLKGRSLNIFEIIVHDGSAYLKIKWFNQPYMQKSLRPGQTIIATGTVRANTYDMPPVEMESPEYEMVSDDADSLVHTKRVIPVYGLTEGLGQKQFRKIMFSVISDHAGNISDYLPGSIISRYGLPGLSESIRQLHFPGDSGHIDELNSGTDMFHRRLVFDELFLFELGLAIMKHQAVREKGISFRPEGRLVKALLRLLPFELTSAQNRVIGEIRRDMRADNPMHRLVQGDVGCGKTLVALAAMLDAVESGYQAALMAPTEILAGQHYLNIHRLAGSLGLRPVLLTGSSKIHKPEDIESAELVIGTHALIQEKVRFSRLGLVVIDEQHKFGVMQRAAFRKKGLNPDLLVMTATPIPRSLALTLYGDLDCSVIDELPPLRRPVYTKWTDSSDRDEIYGILRKQISMGRQVYVVYPSIEESENADLKSAVRGREAFELKFPEFRTGLLHGRMKTEEREQVMDLFKKGGIDILVSTTVIEVGVDVPNATVMLVVHAERFGLSQLHQLRGRVGRGAEESFCILIAYQPLSEDARRRLDILAQSNDGFRIAEEDLAIRGQGDFLGTRQAGVPDLKHADMSRDSAVLETARHEAFNIIERDPELKESPSLKKRVNVFWKARTDLYRTG